jgi:hypothetical protein
MFGFGENVRPDLIGPHISFLTYIDHQNLNFITDFRSIYFEIMVSWFGQSISTAEKVLGSKFPYYNTNGFIKTSVPDKSLPPAPEVPKPDPNSIDPGNPLSPSNTVTEKDKFTIYPNPVTQSGAYLNMSLFLPDNVSISQHSLDGKTLAVLHKKNYRAGLYTIFLDLKGGPGPYFIKILVGRRTHALKVLKIN